MWLVYCYKLEDCSQTRVNSKWEPNKLQSLRQIITHLIVKHNKQSLNMVIELLILFTSTKILGKENRVRATPNSKKRSKEGDIGI